MLVLVTLSGQAQTKRKATSTVEQISIKAEATLNPQQKVTAHMKANGYDGPIGIKLRGNSSLSFNQKKYTIELRDESGKDVAASLLGMPAHSDWVLLAPYNGVPVVARYGTLGPTHTNGRTDAERRLSRHLYPFGGH